MPKFEDIRAAQKLVWTQAEKAAGRALLPTERSTATRLIAAALDNPSGAPLAELARWVRAPFTEQAPAGRSFTEAGVLTGAILEQAPTTAPPASKGLLEDLAKLSRAELAETALAVGEARNRSPFWQRQARVAGQVSESAGAAPVRSREAREADYARAATLPLTEARELREALMAEFARTQPFGGQRLDQA